MLELLEKSTKTEGEMSSMLGLACRDTDTSFKWEEVFVTFSCCAFLYLFFVILNFDVITFHNFSLLKLLTILCADYLLVTFVYIYFLLYHVGH